MFLKEFREFIGLSQKDFAEKLGLTQASIARYETDKMNPTTTVISFLFVPHFPSSTLITFT